MPILVTSMSAKYNKMTDDTWRKSLLATNPNVVFCIISEDMPEEVDYTNKVRPRGVFQLAPSLNHTAFCEAAKLELSLHPELDQTNYRWQPIRFSYKPFAIMQAATMYPFDELYWFDADVEFTAEIPFSEIAPYDLAGVSYLGRVAYAHSEAGFVGIGSFAKRFVTTWYDYYRTGRLFNLPEWHDVVAMDRALFESGVSRRNLSGGISDKHPWPKTVLAEFSKHHKGPRRKQDRFNSNEALHGVIYHGN